MNENKFKVWYKATKRQNYTELSSNQLHRIMIVDAESVTKTLVFGMRSYILDSADGKVQGNQFS